MLFNDFNILMEAPKKKPVEKSNYTDDPEDTGVPEADPATDETAGGGAGDETTDYTTDEADVDPTDPGGGTDPADPGGDTGDPNYTGDDPNDPGGDPGDNPDTGNPADQSTDEHDKQYSLIQSFIDLYHATKVAIERISSVKKTDLTITTVVNQVIKNITTLRGVLFQYIYTIFQNKKYIENLYQFNCFIEAFNINIQMLKKIKDLNIV